VAVERFDPDTMDPNHIQTLSTSATSLPQHIAASPVIIVDRNMDGALSISSRLAIKTES
jgi:hypothetical protein